MRRLVAPVALLVSLSAAAEEKLVYDQGGTKVFSDTPTLRIVYPDAEVTFMHMGKPDEPFKVHVARIKKPGIEKFYYGSVDDLKKVRPDLADMPEAGKNHEVVCNTGDRKCAAVRYGYLEQITAARDYFTLRGYLRDIRNGKDVGKALADIEKLKHYL